MKISFLSLTATLAATVPYLTSAALLDFFVPESSAAASTESLPDSYSKVLKKISKKRKVQTLKPSIPSLSSKNEEEEGVDIIDRDLESYLPSDCEYETMTNTFEGTFGSRTMELVDYLETITTGNNTENCFMSFDEMYCIINGTNYEYYFEDHCTSTQGTIAPYALTKYCGSLSTQTISVIGLPMCLSNTCDDVTDFLDNLNISFWYERGTWPEATDDCEFDGISEWFDDTAEFEDLFYCDEEDEAKSEFVYKMKDGQEVNKTCGWLDQFPMELKYIPCTDYSSLVSAPNVCPKACCTCKEHPEDRFFVTMKENKKGKLKAKTAECSRIDDIDDPFFKYQLCHRESQKPKLVGNGNTVCPQSCGTCPSPEMFMDDGEDEHEYDD